MGSAKVKVLLVGAAFLVGLGLSLWLERLPMPGAGGVHSRQPPARGFDYRYRRVICMSPAVAEIVFALGAGGRVVGVSQHTRYPPEALSKPVCGGYLNPNFEMILSLEPDLVVTQGKAEDLTAFAQANLIDIVSLELQDLESIFEQTKRAGRVLEAEAEAELLCAEMRHRLAQIRLDVSRKPRVSVVLVTGREPGTLNNIYAVGPGTFLDDLVEVAGGRNVFAGLHSGYAVVNKEALLERAPEVVVELHGEGADRADREREVRDLWRGLAPLPAVRDGRVHVIEATYAMIPGPRVVLLAVRLADIFHGEGR